MRISHTRNRQTLYLDYEAYEDMALKQMESLSREAITRFGVRHVTLIHRLGRLNISETSVLIVVASAHRAQAFDACRWLIPTRSRKPSAYLEERNLRLTARGLGRRRTFPRRHPPIAWARRLRMLRNPVPNHRADVHGALILFLVVLLFAPLALLAQDTTFRMDVKLVNLFVNVTDKTGAIVGGLTKDDFQISEDGRPQKIAVFERQSELPLNLILAIDTSGSTAKDLNLEQSASKRFIHALLREQDQMSLISFATNVYQLVPFTNRIQQLDRGLGSLRVGDATALYDAIYLGSEGLAKKDGRKVHG